MGMILEFIFGAMIVGLCIFGIILLFGVKMVKGMAGGRENEEVTDEARTIQELYQGYLRMEERLEALETILLEREREREENKS